MTTSALERVIRRSEERTRVRREHCEMCSAPVPEAHRHLLDTERGDVMCACQACCLLFDREAASHGHYRLIPERRVAVPDLDTSSLGVPVGLAYFVVQPDGRLAAHYPSPAGATQWEVDAAAWQQTVRDHPVLAEMAPAVEGLLVNTTAHLREAWIVPVDACLRLVAIVRREWKGLSGGDRVRPAIERFFDEIRS